MKKRLSITGVIVLVLVAGLVARPLVAYDHGDPRARPNSYLIKAEEIADAPLDAVFSFIKNQKDDVYEKYNEMHSTFRILNGEALEEGAEIKCVEGDDSEETVHRYKVTRCVENQLIQYESLDTKIYELENGKRKEVGSCRVFVYFDFKRTSDGKTSVTQTLVIDMKNPLYKTIGDIVGLLSGSRTLWDEHAHEELRGILSLAEISWKEGRPIPRS